MIKVIGLSGFARSGKDTLCEFLIKEYANIGITAKRFALADQLKKDLDDFLVTRCSISSFTSITEEKTLIRPILVEYGRLKRTQSNGTYWTNLLEQEIKSQAPEVAIVTDVRYNIFPKDEVFWLKATMCGVLVHIRRFDMITIGEECSQPIKSYHKAPNEDERINDPSLIKNADILMDSPTLAEEELKSFYTSNAKFIISQAGFRFSRNII